MNILGAKTPYRFDGSDYDPQHDAHRLTKQLHRIWSCMCDGQWRTLHEIAEITGDPEASISAQLRHLRKPRFGSHTILKRARGDRDHGLFEYQLQINWTLQAESEEGKTKEATQDLAYQPPATQVPPA